MESLTIFHDFKLSELSEDWVEFIWKEEFLTYNDPPDEYLMFLESQDMKLLLKESCAIVKSWLTENYNEIQQHDSNVSWSALVVLDIKVRALLAVLGYIIKTGQSREADEDLRQSCLYATSLYFILLAIPGSTAFNVFHVNLYERAIETFNMSEHLLPIPKKRNKSVSMDAFSNSDESFTDIPLTPYERSTLANGLNNAVYDFTFMIKSFSFKDRMESLDVTIRGLLELTKVENDIIEAPMQGRNRSVPEVPLSQNAYTTLESLCDNKHGSSSITITIIAKYLLPRLICNHADTQIKLMANIRDSTVCFLKSLLEKHENESRNAFIILTQHLMVKYPDKVEGRQRQANVLVKLLSISKQHIIMEAFKNVILLSHHNQIPYRIFAQEILGKFLNEPFLLEYDLTESWKSKIKRILFALALSKCMDCSNMVRGRALATVAEFIDANNNMNRTIVRDIFENRDLNKTFPMFNELLEAMSKNWDPLPGSKTLISMLSDRIEDERALVRRSTLQIFKNLTQMFPNLIEEAIPIISRRCRDPMLIVRRFAVEVLSQLLDKFPDNNYLLEEWIQSVVPQIFDIEVKVQEKVLEHLEELLLYRIKEVSTCNGNIASHLPWKILNLLTSMKMRKHLSKACSLWEQKGILTKSILINIQSHIGTDNDIPAWVLLAALAENTKLPNISKYISNYKELLEQNDFHVGLVLHVLKYSWSSLDRQILESLHLYLYESLEEFKIHFGLISICLDIINMIMLHLQDNDTNDLIGSKMSKLMRNSEAKIEKVLSSESEVADVAPIYLKAMFTLSHAALFCTSRISPLTLRILEGLLLEWDTLPGAVKKIDELQASAVVILGQQAMRDREIAQEVIPIFGRLMRQEPNVDSFKQIAVKINSAKALADICVRFTALVEPYLSDMCVSMKDASPEVRETIIIIFIQLLLEDFIKIKGPFFFHILTMLSDPDEMIRELTVFLIGERLLAKNKTLISQQFLESIYHYNNYCFHSKFYDRKMREKERKALTLPGKRNQEKRRIIYDFLLEHLDPPEKIKLLVKITSQILSGAYNSTLDIRKEEGACVLNDALYIISNERLQPSSFTKNADDQEQEEQTVPVLAPAANAMNIIIEGVKKHGVDVLLPMLIKLQKQMVKLQSPLEKDVKRVLVKTYLDYSKEQLVNILHEYPNLEKQIEEYRRELGKNHTDPNDEDLDNEDALIADNQTSLNKDLVQRTPNITPIVLLHRLPAARISHWTNSSKTSDFPTLSPHSLDSWGSTGPPSSIPPLHTPTQDKPSTSTPKSSRCVGGNSDHAIGCLPKARKLSAFFQDTKVSDTFEKRVAEDSGLRSRSNNESD